MCKLFSWIPLDSVCYGLFHECNTALWLGFALLRWGGEAARRTTARRCCWCQRLRWSWSWPFKAHWIHQLNQVLQSDLYRNEHCYVSMFGFTVSQCGLRCTMYLPLQKWEHLWTTKSTPKTCNANQLLCSRGTVEGVDAGCTHVKEPEGQDTILAQASRFVPESTILVHAGVFNRKPHNDQMVEISFTTGLYCAILRLKSIYRHRTRIVTISYRHITSWYWFLCRSDFQHHLFVGFAAVYKFSRQELRCRSPKKNGTGRTCGTWPKPRCLSASLIIIAILLDPFVRVLCVTVSFSRFCCILKSAYLIKGVSY